MNIESQVCSLQLAKRLKELNVKQDSLFVWEYFNDNCYAVKFKIHAAVPNKFLNDGVSWFSAYTVGELDNLLPDSICFGLPKEGEKQYYSIIYSKHGNNYHANIINIPVSKMIPEIISDNPANTKALLLIKLIENKLMEVPK